MISVAMCTYNGEKYIKEQLNSIIKQTQKADEIIICDDGSTDNTLMIVRQVLGKWNGHFEIYSNEINLGCTKNFEKAISCCSGDIIFLTDQDDVWNLDKISIIYKEFTKNNNILMVFHDAVLVDENLSLLYPSNWAMSGFNPEWFKQKDYTIMLEHNVVQGSACAFKKELYNQAKPFPKEAVHDEWLALVACSSGKILPVSSCLMQYRQWESNLIGGQVLTFYGKLRTWLLNTQKKSEFHYKQLLNKRVIFSTYCEREYDIHNISPYVTVEQYRDFLNKRIECIIGKNMAIIRLFIKYKNSYINRKHCFKVFVEDLLSMYYRKTRM